jgi:hypothetical protein
MDKQETIMCPSHRCKPGSQILGVRQEDGSIAILPQTLPVDEDFVAKTKDHPVPAERRFRFTNKCVESGCKQWNGKGCGVVERVMDYLDVVPSASLISNCPLRKSCRWFFQRGENACKVCPLIPTEIAEEDHVSPQQG